MACAVSLASISPSVVISSIRRTSALSVELPSDLSFMLFISTYISLNLHRQYQLVYIDDEYTARYNRHSRPYTK